MESSWKYVGIYTDEEDNFSYDLKGVPKDTNPAVQEIIGVQQLKFLRIEDCAWIVTIHMNCQVSIWEIYMPNQSPKKLKYNKMLYGVESALS